MNVQRTQHHLPVTPDSLRCGCKLGIEAAVRGRRGPDLRSAVRGGLRSHGRLWICLRRSESAAKAVSSAPAFPTALPPDALL